MKFGTIILAAIAALGVAALVLFQAMGSSIDADGFLREPFYLIPIGYLLIFIGVGGIALPILRRLIRSPR